MKMFRMVLAAFVMAGLGSATLAADKADNKKLIVGKWEATKADEGTLPTGSIVEFTADGKIKVAPKAEGKTDTIEGTYTVDGDSFTFKVKFGDQEISQKIKIKKISATELDTMNQEDKNVSFKKVK